MQATAGVKYSLVIDEPLFSDESDYRHFLDVLAGHPHLNIAAFCLLPQQLHLLALGQPDTLPERLLHALTGEPHHPLSQAFKQQFISREQLPQTLTHLHKHPIQAGASSSPGGYRWSSHHCYAGAEPVPAWLAVDAFWQTQAVRRASWAKTYTTWLALNPPAPLFDQEQEQTVPEEGLEPLLARVLSDFQCTQAQLHHARMRRRREELGGIIWAACKQFGIEETLRLTRFFQLPEATLAQASTQAERQHACYLHSLTRAFSAKAARKLTQEQSGQSLDWSQHSGWGQTLSVSDMAHTPNPENNFPDSDALQGSPQQSLTRPATRQ